MNPGAAGPPGAERGLPLAAIRSGAGRPRRASDAPGGAAPAGAHIPWGAPLAGGSAHAGREPEGRAEAPRGGDPPRPTRRGGRTSQDSPKARGRPRGARAAARPDRREGDRRPDPARRTGPDGGTAATAAAHPIAAAYRFRVGRGEPGAGDAARAEGRPQGGGTPTSQERADKHRTRGSGRGTRDATAPRSVGRFFVQKRATRRARLCPFVYGIVLIIKY